MGYPCPYALLIPPPPISGRYPALDVVLCGSLREFARLIDGLRSADPGQARKDQAKYASDEAAAKPWNGAMWLLVLDPIISLF